MQPSYFENLIAKVEADWIRTTCSNKDDYIESYAKDLGSVLRFYGIDKSAFIATAKSKMVDKVGRGKK